MYTHTTQRGVSFQRTADLLLRSPKLLRTIVLDVASEAEAYETDSRPSSGSMACAAKL